MTVRAPAAPLSVGHDAVQEGRRIARHLLGEDPPTELAGRYADACRTLFADPAAPEDAALLDFVRRHPWSLGPLDAAAALRRPGARLRGKVLVMAAILETSPRYAARFLPQDAGPVRLVAALAWYGAAAVARTAAGLLLWPFAVRAARRDGGPRP